MSASNSELRLVLLERKEAGRRSALCSILGLEDSEQGEEPTSISSKYSGEAAGRQVTVISSPDWFSSECDPERRRTLVSSFISMSAPGPHAFLLCVPLNQPAEGAVTALDVLEKLFGPSSVSGGALVLFTHTEELDEDERLDGYLDTWRKDLKALAGRCGGRYHSLESGGGEESVREMMVKVEEMLEGSSFFTCELYQEEVKKRQVELLEERRGEEEEEATEGDLEEVREEAEGSVELLDLDLESLFPPVAVVSTPSFLQQLWEKMTGWTKTITKYMRKEALLGALVGLFVGGPFGGVIGATVGSVATEVRRRNTQKTK